MDTNDAINTWLNDNPELLRTVGIGGYWIISFLMAFSVGLVLYKVWKAITQEPIDTVAPPRRRRGTRATNRTK